MDQSRNADAINAQSMRQSFTMLFQGAAGSLDAYARQLCGPQRHASMAPHDLLQESMTTAWMRFEELKRPDDFPRWSRGIMRRHHLNHTRLALRRSTTPMADMSPGFEADLPSQDQRMGLLMDIANALRSMGEQERDALLMYSLAGFSIGEIAECAACSPECARKRLERARRHMRTLLDVGPDGRSAHTEGRTLLAETLRVIENAESRLRDTDRE